MGVSERRSADCSFMRDRSHADAIGSIAAKRNLFVALFARFAEPLGDVRWLLTLGNLAKRRRICQRSGPPFAP